MTTSTRRALFATHPPIVNWKKVGKQTYLDSALVGHAERMIYRYASFAEALSLVNQHRWSFARPTLWPDKYEQHVAQELFDPSGPFGKIVAYVKCFSFEYSSQAMWRTYASSGGLVRLGMRIKDLISSLDAATWPVDAKLYVARVRYMEERDIRRSVRSLRTSPPKVVSRNATRALLMKRSGFVYENEIRACSISLSEGELPPVHLVCDAPSAPITRMLIDPYLPPWQAAEIKLLFEKHLKVPFKVAQSSFDVNPAELDKA